MAYGGQRICLYLSGRSHAGENLDALLKQRDPALAAPIVMSDALAANRTEAQTIEAHCLAHGQRYFSDIELSRSRAARYLVLTPS